MNVIPKEQHVLSEYFPGEPIHGIEFVGEKDALLFAQSLGALASNEIAPYRPVSNKKHVLSEIATPLAADTLAIQGKLLETLTTNDIGDNPFSLVARTNRDGRIMHAAAQLDSEAIAKTQERVINFTLLSI